MASNLILNNQHIPFKTGVITEEDEAFANEVIEQFPEAFLGGSWVVLGLAATDIDVVVPQAIWPQVRAYLTGRIFKVQAELPTEAEDQGTDRDDDDRLVTVYRRGNVDLLVVTDAFVPSYRKAVDTMAANPDLFLNREERVALHIHFADEYRKEHGLPLEEEVITARRLRMGWVRRSSSDYTGR